MLGPIFARESLTLPRRPRHYLMRSVFLGALWVLILTVWQTSVGWEHPATLGDQARFGLLAFQLLVFVQLLLLLFFSALSAASTVALEKDRRTFILLLLTDLRNHEIVLGKLLGSLLQIGIFLAGSVPVLGLLMLLGGIDPEQILQATLVLLTTTLAAGSLGSLIALWREKTYQSIALTFLVLILYVCIVQAFSLLPALLPVDADLIERAQTWLQPFLVLVDVIDPQHQAGVLPAAYAYALAMLGWALLLNGWAMWKLRVWNPSGEPVMQRDAADVEKEEKDRARAHAAPGAVRQVWENPVLWREIATRAYGRRPLLVKAAYFLVVGMVCYFALAPEQPGDWAAARGLVPVAVLSLLLISAQAVTAITSERDLGALDLLLVTDLSAREFLFGKMAGILYNTKEYLLPPIALAAVYALRGMLASPPVNHPELGFGMNLESFVSVALGTLILFAFAIVLGVHIGLRTSNSRLAILHTLGTVFFLSVGTMICIYLILINGRFEYQFLSFSAFVFCGILGLFWVLNGNNPSTALTVAAFICPLAVFYSVTNILIGKPGLRESADPLIPFLVTGGAFGFTVAAMLVPLLSEFDTAIGRTSAVGE